MLAVALAIILSITATTTYFVVTQHRRMPRLKFEPQDMPEIGDGIHLLAGLTNSAVYDGNQVTVFQNGDIFPAFKESIEAATQSIHFEIFVWTKGEVEREFVELFCRKAKEGVTVRILVDAIGGMEADESQWAKLREAGVVLNIYCKARWWNLRRMNHRTHRKLLIVDGQVGYTCGHGISDLWLGQGQDPEHWRDTGVRIVGPAVQALQTVFMENWLEETKHVITTPECFPALSKAGDTPAHVVSSAGGDAISAVGLLYTLAIGSAKQEVIIQNPYFAPEKSVVDLMGDMVERGVKVHLMVPGKQTDSPFVRSAGCYLYRALLEKGVHLYEYQQTLPHQKIIIVDGHWVHVGSTNFDARSLALNEEVGVGLLDKAIAHELREAFFLDLQSCQELELSVWRKRPWHKKIKEFMAYMLRSQI